MCIAKIQRVCEAVYSQMGYSSKLQQTENDCFPLLSSILILPSSNSLERGYDAFKCLWKLVICYTIVSRDSNMHTSAEIELIS